MRVDWNKFFDMSRPLNPGVFFLSAASSGWLFWAIMGRHALGLVWAVGNTLGLLYQLYQARVVDSK